MTAERSNPALAGERGVAYPPRFWWMKRILPVLIFLLLSPVLIFLWWSHAADQRLAAEIAAIQARGEPILPAEWTSPPIPDPQNAAILLRQAAASITTTSQEDSLLALGDFDVMALDEKALAALRGYLGTNASAIDMVAKARQRPQVNWNVRLTSPVVNVMLPDLGEQRTLASLLCTAAMYSHRQGDDAAAFARVHDAMFVARSTESLPFVLSHLLSSGLRSMAAETALSIAHELGAPVSSTQPSTPVARDRVQQLIAEFLDDAGLRESAARAWQTERIMVLDAVNNPPPYFQSDSALEAPGRKLDAVRLMRESAGACRAALASDMPAAERELAQTACLDPLAEPVPFLLIRSMYMMRVARGAVINRGFRALTASRVAATALALRLYEIDHARLPARLDELVGVYLKEVPKDPFAADGRPLGYKPVAQRPFLYSVGEDGRDDGGDPSPAVNPGRANLSLWQGKDFVFDLRRQPKPVQTLPPPSPPWGGWPVPPGWGGSSPIVPPSSPPSTQAVDDDGNEEQQPRQEKGE